MPIDIPHLKEALELWESYLAGIHDCDLGEPEAVAVLHINDAAGAVVEADLWWRCVQHPTMLTDYIPNKCELGSSLAPGHENDDWVRVIDPGSQP